MKARCLSSASITSSIPIFCAATVLTTGGRHRPGSVRSPREIMWRRSRTVASAPSRSALLTTKTSPISRMPALAAWMPSPMPGREQHDRGVGEAGDLDLGLADADGLDEHDVAPGGVEHADRLRRRPGQPAEVPARGHRADVDLGVERVVLHADPVAEQGAAGERRATGRRRAPRPAGPARGRPPTRAVVDVDLPTPGRAGEADDVGVAGVRRERGHHLTQRRVAVLDERDEPRDGTRRTRPGRLDQGRDVDGRRATRRGPRRVRRSWARGR